MRKFALTTSVCAVLLFATLAQAQQIDVAVGDGITRSPKNYSASLAYPPPAETGGMYPSFSADFIRKDHLGLNAEIAVRYKKGLYNGYQEFRPVFYDFNAVFAPRLGRKISADFMAGFGGESVVFYNQFGRCNYDACITYTNSDHLMGHLSAGVRYYFWRSFFIRPEAHLYLIHNNFQFSSGYVARVGASIGYTFRPH